jgi:ComEC/Rec2-related protein
VGTDRSTPLHDEGDDRGDAREGREGRAASPTTQYGSNGADSHRADSHRADSHRAGTDRVNTITIARRRAAIALAAFIVGLVIARWLGDSATAHSILRGGIGSGAWFAAALAMLIGCVCTRNPRAAGAMLTLAMVALGAGWFTLRIHEVPRPALPANLVAHLATDQGDAHGAIVAVEGVVASTPRFREPDVTRPFDGGSWHFDLSLRSVGPVGAHAADGASDDHTLDTTSGTPANPRLSTPARGILWTSVSGSRARGGTMPALGQRVRVTGVLDTLTPPRNPGERDIRPIARQRSVVGTLALHAPSSRAARAQPLIVALDQPNDLRGTLDHAMARAAAARAWLRARARDVVARASGAGPANSRDALGASTSPASHDSPNHQAPPSRQRALIEGLLLGEFDPDERDVRDAFARQGLVHVLSISGFHLTVLAAVTLALVRATGDRGRLEALIVAALVIAFMLIVPAQSPIIRSGTLVLALLAAEATGRRYDRLTTLMWIALALLLWRPLDAWSIGYQLSVGMTALLFWRGEAFHQRLWRSIVESPPRGVLRPRTGLVGALLAWIRGGISCGVLCALASAPIVAWHAGLISVLGVVVGLLVTPVIVAALWIGYAALLVGMFVPWIADAAAWVLGSLASASIAIVGAFDAMPWTSVVVAPVPWAWAGAATAAAVWWIAGRTDDVGTPGALAPSRARGTIVAAVLAAWLAIAWAGWASPRFDVGHMLARAAVGESAHPGRVVLRIDAFSVGDATSIIVRSEDEALMWDAGGPTRGGVLPPLVEWSRAVGAWRVGTLVLTHADADHYGAADTVIRPLGVQRVLTTSSVLAQAAGAKPTPRARVDSPLPEVMTRVEAALARRSGLDEPEGAARDAASTHDDAAREIEPDGILTIARGDAWTMGASRVRVLWPPRDVGEVLPNAIDNDTSLVVVVEVDTRAGPRRLLLTGDATDRAIGAIRALEPDLRADIMEAPHHGAASPPTLRWIAAIGPAAVVQSSGPRKATDPRLASLREARTWLATGVRGHSWIEVREDGSMRAGSRAGSSAGSSAGTRDATPRPTPRASAR